MITDWTSMFAPLSDEYWPELQQEISNWEKRISDDPGMFNQLVWGLMVATHRIEAAELAERTSKGAYAAVYELLKTRERECDMLHSELDIALRRAQDAEEGQERSEQLRSAAVERENISVGERDIARQEARHAEGRVKELENTLEDALSELADATGKTKAEVASWFEPPAENLSSATRV